jgi:nucleoid-associated protein YgaU
MNTKNTWAWFVVAAVLFASIFVLDRYLRPPAVLTQNVLPGLQPSVVTSIQVIPAGAFEIRADRTNNSWLLAKPIAYPAQTAAIETLLAALQKLTPATRISAGELREHRTASADFGFDSPQTSLVVEAGDQRWQLLVGNKTAPGDQVFLRVVGVDDTFVADADWLKFIPYSANDWRSTALVAADESTCDSIVLTNGAKVIELRRDATNHLWRMIRPLQARADSDRITYALQELQTAQVLQFVTDDAKADLAAFGLQPADLDLWLNQGTNFISAIHTGKSATNDTAQIYAKREGWSAVFTTAGEPLSPWRGTVNDFRDPHLLELTAPVAEIEVRGQNNFILQQQGSNDWKVVGEKFPADTENVQLFVKLLAGMRVAEFVKDVVTAPDLPAYGLAMPTRQIILRSAAGDSNAVIAQLAFAMQTNGIFIHRADEDFIYSITPADFNRLPEADWEFRDRRIWNFNETNVAQITLRQSGKTRVMVRNGPNKWSLAPGSQGIINPPALEETTHRLGELSALGWVARNVTEPEKNYGLNPDNLEITVELKSGEKFSTAFGTELTSAHTAMAAVTLDGERWVFVFPPVLYQFVLFYFTIPANVP